MDCGRHSLLIVVVTVWTVMGGCGTQKPRPDGAAAEVSPTDTATLPDGVSGAACDPGLQDCPAGSKCDFFCSGTSPIVGCRADDGAGLELGVTCGGNRACKKGSGCFAAAGSNAVCRRYCTSDGDCPTGQCQVATITIACGGVSMPVTMRICF